MVSGQYTKSKSNLDKKYKWQLAHLLIFLTILSHK